MAVNFLKIDLLRTRKIWYILLLPIIVLFFLGRDTGTPGLFGLAYCLFIGMILASFPPNLELSGERGFLTMLPAKPGADIRGHFLFAALSVVVFTVIGAIMIAVAKVMNPDLLLFKINGIDVSGFYLVIVGAAFIFCGFELFLLILFRYKSVQAQQLLRIVPAFIFFFGMSSLSDRAETVEQSDLSFGIGAGSIAFLAAAIVIFIVLTEISVRIDARRY